MDRKQVITAEVARLQEELAKLSQFGDDVYNNGTVVKWKKQFNGAGIKYQFAAIKAGGFWYLTNRDGYKLTWAQMVQLLADEGVTQIRVSKTWAKMGVGATE